MPMMQTRRRFLSTVSLAGAAGLLHAPLSLAAEGALETTSVRLVKDLVICEAPLDVAEELLRAEGFTDIRYVDIAPPHISQSIVRGEVDFGLSFPVFFLPAIDSGVPITVLAGVHVGCFELFARDGIRSIAELRGRSVGLKASPPGLLTLMAAQVGLDPAKDIHWVTDPSVKPPDLFAEGKIDAFLGFPPEPQELRARNAGHVILNTALDRPWSQYFCCMLMGNRDHIRKYPVATKRVLRAILKATDLCATEPERAGRRLVDGGFTERLDYARQTLNDVPYNNWREYNAEDTIRFYALRMHEAGLIKSSPNKLIADGTDWRFLNELKRELKA
jgi:NitT/TauT family transport system substrate-binding protein